MLNATDLANQLINAMGQANTPQLAHGRFTPALVNYLKSNMEVQGIYTGVTNTTPPLPDPSNGSYTWNPSTLVISSSAMQSGATGGLSGWISTMKTALNQTIFLGADKTGRISTSVPSMLVVTSISIDFGSKPEDMNSAFQLVAQGIINAIKSGTVVTPALATSNTNGTGVVAWGAIS